MKVRILLPTYLYIGMLPLQRRALHHHARAHDHVGLAVLQRREQVLHHLRGVLAVAVEQHDDVEAALHRVLVALALVAAVHQVDGVLEDRELAVRQSLPGSAWPTSWVLSWLASSKTKISSILSTDRLGDAVQHAAQRGLGVVGDDQDSDAGAVHG